MPNPFNSRLCGGIHKAAIGQRMFWLECGLRHGHTGRHFSAKRNFYWDELFYWDEFDWYGKEVAKKPKRKKGWATTKDVLVKRGAKRDVMAQHREQQSFEEMKRPEAPVSVTTQASLALSEELEPYYGQW